MKKIMNYKFYILILFFLFSSFKAFAIPRCEELLDVVYNDTIKKDVNINTIEDQKTIGIRLEKYWSTEKLYSGTWELLTNADGYFIVGKVTKGSLSNQIMQGDVILSINDIDLRELAKDTNKKMIMKIDISDLFEVDELIKFEILRKNETTNKEEIIIVDRKYKSAKEPNLKNTLESFDNPKVDFYVNSIEVNEKKGFFDASIETSFLEIIDERYFLLKAIFDTIVYDKVYDDKSRLTQFWYERCSFPDEEWHKLNTKEPDYGMKFDNLIKEDLTTRNSHYHIEPDWSVKFIKDENGEYIKDKNGEIDWSKTYFKPDKAKIIYKSISSYRIKNSFNLKTFPFDKQKLTIYLKNEINNISQHRSAVTGYTMRRALEFKDSNSIQGWNITGVDAKYHITRDMNERIYNDGVKLEFEIERKSRYYVFKIILPILLILSVCWSAVWIDPKEIESRLTITIVCLLSLIAYNFVIDSDMPKLEYLTIMDYIILISYVYATIPNFLSILAFNLIRKNKKLCQRYESYGKRYGVMSYFIFVFLIIVININASPEHTNATLSWMSLN
tara:strand:+ start:371 stop:2044 length:1674 start_codon:yes stop_codon:yes gene_type:complete